jgi:hypothetical protein
MRGEASRLGSKKSGLTGEVASWTAGVRLRARAEEGRDEISIVVDSGNRQYDRSRHIGWVRSGGVFVPSVELKKQIIEEYTESLLIPGRE